MMWKSDQIPIRIPIRLKDRKSQYSASRNGVAFLTLMLQLRYDKTDFGYVLYDPYDLNHIKTKTIKPNWFDKTKTLLQNA